MSSKTRENTITGMFAAIMQVINSENISDPTAITEAAQKSKTTMFARELEEWLNERGWEQAEEIRLKKLGYPDFTLSRLTPGVDEKEPFFDGTLISLWHPNQRIGAEPYDNPQGTWIYWIIKCGNRLLSCIGLQTLIWYRDNRSSIPPEWEGKTICAWKSVINNNVDPVRSVELVPVMFIEPDNPVLKIEWKNLLDFFSPDHMTPIITA